VKILEDAAEKFFEKGISQNAEKTAKSLKRYRRIWKRNERQIFNLG